MNESNNGLTVLATFYSYLIELFILYIAEMYFSLSSKMKTFSEWSDKMWIKIEIISQFHVKQFSVIKTTKDDFDVTFMM